MSRQVKVSFYVQLEPTFGTPTRLPLAVTSAKAVAISQDKPVNQLPGTLLVKLTIEVDEQHLLQVGGHRG